MQRGNNDRFYEGVLCALAVVYEADGETIAETVVRTVGARELLSIARKIKDPWLSNLQKTIRFLKEQDRASRC